MRAVNIRGTLTDGVAVAQPIANVEPPTTVTLKSAAAGRRIEVSTDGGTEYATPSYDTNTAATLAVALMAPATHVRFTGQAGDVWSVL